MALVEVKVPDIGDFKDVAVIELLVQPGDTVKAEQSLLSVESDKASMEIPSSHTGVVKDVRVKLGDKINEGSVIVTLEVADAVAQASPEPSSGATPDGGSPAARETGVASADVPAPAPGSASGAASAPPPRAPAGGRASVEVVVPDIGYFGEVAVIEVMVKPGDTVQVEQSLITVESDKASMEIPSSHAGVVKEMRVKVGDKVSQ
ncbi:MAG: biotin/lipoyl-containing protein, partial [Burkholderiaceae bacterium]